MIRELATIQTIADDYLEVSTELKTGCGSCAQQNTCGAGVISKAFSDRRATFRVNRPAGEFSVGEQVELLLPEQMLTQASLLIYGVPLIALFLMAVLSQSLLGFSEGVTIIAAFTAFIGSFWALKQWFKRRDIQVSQFLKVQQLL